MSATQYGASAVELGVLVCALGFGAYRVRRRLIPSWSGAIARLAELILGLAAMLWIGEALGTIGLLKEVPLVIATLAVGVGAGIAAGSPPVSPSGEEGGRAQLGVAEWLAIAVAVGSAAFVVAHWSLHTQVNYDRGMYGFDTMWYHMPFAAGFVQSGSVTHLHYTDPLYLNWFYPNNSELLHAAGILVFAHHDLLSPIANLAWVGTALLAAWCVGRPYGVGAAAVVAVALVLDSHTLVSRQPGDAKNDIVGMAFLLSSVALLVNAEGLIADARGRLTALAGRRAPLGLAGLAAGLALGTKLTLLAPAAALTAGVIALGARGSRRAVTAVFGGMLLAGGGYWYLRDFVRAGSPLPWVHHLGVGPLTLPSPERLLEGRPPFAVAHYITDGHIWDKFFLPGLEQAFGHWWWATLGLAAMGVVLSVALGRSKLIRMLGLVAGVAAIAYVFTPLTASGPEGMPAGFVLNLRYLAPALVVGIALLPLVPWLSGRWRQLLLAAIFAIVIWQSDRPREILLSHYEKGAIVVAILAVVVPCGLAVLRGRGVPRLVVALAALALFAAVVKIGDSEQRYYLEKRYSNAYTKFHLDSAFRWANTLHGQRIAIGGTTGAFFQYGLYGGDLSNRVQYVGHKGPDGAFSAILDCADWRRAINAGGYRYVVATPFFNQNTPAEPLPSAEAAWTGFDPGAVELDHDGPVKIFQIVHPLDPTGCAHLPFNRMKVEHNELHLVRNPNGPPPLKSVASPG